MPDSLDPIQTSIKGAATTIAAIAGVGVGPTAIVEILADAVFRGIRLGRAIRAEQQRASADLSAIIKARGILRTPIIVDLTPLQVRSFYRNDANLNIFTPLRTQFSPELDEFNESGGSVTAKTFDILEAAMQLVPQVHVDLRFDDGELDALLGIWLNPAKPDFRGMVKDYLTLCPRPGFTYASHYERMKDFWQDRIVQEIASINRAELQAQIALEQKVGELIRGAIFGTDSFASDALKAAKELKKTEIDEQIAALNRESALSTTTTERKAEITKAIAALTQWKTRIG